MPKEPEYNRRENGQFGKGNNANPGGRPKGTYNFINTLNRKLKEQSKDGKLRGDEIVDKLLELAKGGDRQAIEHIIDRQHGKPKERVQHSDGETVEELLAMDDLTDEELAVLEKVQARKAEQDQAEEDEE